MEILYFLIPMSVLVVLIIMAVFGWALHSGQFDDLEREGERILTDEAPPIDSGQTPGGAQSEQFATSVRGS